MPLDHYVTLGNSGLRVSPFCLGTMTFGEDWDNVGTTVEESVDVLAAYLDRGGNFLDSANIYTKGHSEAIIGDYFAEGAGLGRRDRVVIATKCGGNMFRRDPNGGGSGRKAIIDACEHSLRRLRTDYIDLYYIHFWDRHTPIEETLGALDTLTRAGKIRYAAFSDHPAWVCAKAQGVCAQRGYAPLIGLQIEYSLLQRTPEDDLIPMAMDRGMGVLPWSPLRGGVLSGKFRRDSRPHSETTRVRDDSPHLNERTYDVVDALVEIGDAIGASPAQVALHWVQTQPGVTSTIIGAKRLSQLEDNLAALDITLADEHRARLGELTSYKRHFPHDFIDNVKLAIQNGTTVNGLPAEPWPLAPKNDEERH